MQSGGMTEHPGYVGVVMDSSLPSAILMEQLVPDAFVCGPVRGFYSLHQKL